MSFIKLENIIKTYDSCKDNVVLNNVNLEINEGEMLAIMGPSGSGKSTLLNIIGAMDKQTEGNYYFKGENINKLSNSNLAKFRNENVGFIFQNFCLLKSYSVTYNVGLPMIHKKNISLLEKRKKIKNILQHLGIDDQKDKNVSQLSGGQQQRVAIARALINNPSFIIADEPTGALDQKNGQNVMEILRRVNQQGTTVIIVTHDINVAQKCDRILNIIDGKIVEEI